MCGRPAVQGHWSTRLRRKVLWRDNTTIFPEISVLFTSSCSPVMTSVKQKPKAAQEGRPSSVSHKRNVNMNAFRLKLRDSFCFLVLYVSRCLRLLICILVSGSLRPPASLAALFPYNILRWTEWPLHSEQLLFFWYSYFSCSNKWYLTLMCEDSIILLC